MGQDPSNLRQIGQQQRIGVTLADLLRRVQSYVEDGPLTSWNLHLLQGDRLAALNGLGDWIHGLQSVYLAMLTTKSQSNSSTFIGRKESSRCPHCRT